MENSMGIYFFKAKLFDAFLLELQTSGTLVNYQQFRASILSDAIALRDLIQLKYHAILAGQEIGCDANTMENYYDVNKIVVEYGGKSQDIETNKEEQYQWKHPE